jgi:hypothetical protein
MLTRSLKLIVTTFIVTIVASSCTLGGGPTILDDYGSMYYGNGPHPRPGPHSGIDFDGVIGQPVVAAADGMLTHIYHNDYGCGMGVVIFHSQLERYTIYCHMSQIASYLETLAHPRVVKRGWLIGRVGISGFSNNIPHLHFEVSKEGRVHRSGDITNNEDPFKRIVGCNSPNGTYKSSDLTYPTGCSHVISHDTRVTDIEKTVTNVQTSDQ